MAKASKIPAWEWREAIAAASVPPLTKLVCLTISIHISDAAKGWSIPIKQLMAETGLSNRSLATHIETAVSAGLLTLKRLHNGAGHRSGTDYTPGFPGGRAHHLDEGASPSLDEHPSSGDESLSEGGSHLDEGASPSLSEGGSRQRLSKSKSFQPSHSGRQRKGRATAIDPSAELGETGLAYATGKGLAEVEALAEFEAFKAHAFEKDRKCVRWDAAWQRWILNAIKYAKRDGRKGRASHRDIANQAFEIVEETSP